MKLCVHVHACMQLCVYVYVCVCLLYKCLCVFIIGIKELQMMTTKTAIGRKEMFYLIMHSTHFIYGYMASDI